MWGVERPTPHAPAAATTMPFSGYRLDDPIFAALEALHCPAAEVADALGMDVKTLWGYQLGGRPVPTHLVRRLVALLEERASWLRDVAATLSSARRGMCAPATLS